MWSYSPFHNLLFLFPPQTHPVVPSPPPRGGVLGSIARPPFFRLLKQRALQMGSALRRPPGVCTCSAAQRAPAASDCLFKYVGVSHTGSLSFHHACLSAERVDAACIIHTRVRACALSLPRAPAGPVEWSRPFTVCR